MKKLNLLYALLFISLLICCGKDDEDPSYKKADLIGKWEQTATTIPDDGGSSCTTEKQEVEFSETELKMIGTCDGTSGSFEVDYTFDNKKTVSFEFLGEAKMVILELSNTTLKVDVFYGGQKAGTTTYKKV
jgi:hypothetical protein